MSVGDKLKDCPFDYRETKNGTVQISFKGRTVTNLKGKEAAKFSSKASSIGEQELQLLMAKATGHFKRGNEKVSKNKSSK